MNPLVGAPSSLVEPPTMPRLFCRTSRMSWGEEGEERMRPGIEAAGQAVEGRGVRIRTRISHMPDRRVEQRMEEAG